MIQKAVEITVRGRVQGVGFRFYTQRKANELNIKGFVKNKTDGSVYIEAEGEEDQLEQFVLWCEDGPSWARVTNITKQEVPVIGFKGFSIK